MKYIFLIFFLSSVFLGCSNESKENSKNINEEKFINKNSAADSIIFPEKVLEWVKEWEKVNPQFAIDSFKIYYNGPIEYIISSDYLKIKEFDLYKQLFYFSSDSSVFVDIYSYNTILSKKKDKTIAIFDVDVEASLVDLKNKKQNRLLFLGSMGNFDDVFWINDNEFIIVGYHEDINPKTNDIEYYPNIWHFNLKKDSLIQYLGTPCMNFINEYFEKKHPNIIIE